MTPRQERDRPLPEGDEKARTVRRLFDTISPRYDLVNRVMTLGMDVGWRRRTVRELALPAGSRILDLACGTGDLCRELLAAGHRPVGFDFSHGMLLAAKTDAPLVEADILQLPVRDASADGATCGFALRNVVSLEGLFAELARVVRPGGRIALLETAEPEGRVMRLGHRVYFRGVVPVIGGLLSNREAYSYLPRSTAYLPAPGELLATLRAVRIPRRPAALVERRRDAAPRGDPGMNDPAVPLLESRAVPLGEAFDLLAGVPATGRRLLRAAGRGVAGMAAFPTLTFGATDPSGLAHVVDVLRSSVRRGHDVAPVAMGAYRVPPGRRTAARARDPDEGRCAGTTEVGHGGSTRTIWKTRPKIPRRSMPVLGGAAHEPFADMQLREVPPVETYEDAVRDVGGHGSVTARSARSFSRGRSR